MDANLLREIAARARKYQSDWQCQAEHGMAQLAGMIADLCGCPELQAAYDALVKSAAAPTVPAVTEVVEAEACGDDVA